MPLIVLGIMFGILRLRAPAPYLFPPVFLLVLMAVLGQELLASLVGSGPVGGLGVLVSLAGAWATFVLFIVVPIAIALLPAHALTAALGRLYRAKGFSYLSYLFGSLRGRLVSDPAASGDPGLECPGQRRRPWDWALCCPCSTPLLSSFKSSSDAAHADHLRRHQCPLTYQALDDRDPSPA